MVDKTLPQKYRALARTHLDKAQSLLKGNDGDLPFVCLKLRQCIESLSYGLLALYRNELSKSAMMNWTPRKVLNELQAVDPDANKSRTLSIEIPNLPELNIIAGEDRRFSPRWASVAYNKLSNFLHVPTPKTVETDSETPAAKIRSQCIEYAEFLESVFATEIWHFVSGRFVEAPCECGFIMKRRVETITNDSTFECSECGRIFDVTLIDQEKIEITMRTARWICKKCEAENEIGVHEMEEGEYISVGSAAQRLS